MCLWVRFVQGCKREKEALWLTELRGYIYITKHDIFKLVNMGLGHGKESGVKS